MIVFIDDEKWIIQGMLDRFEDLSERKNKSYLTKHFFYATKALEYITDNVSEVNLIITDIAMDYGDGDLNKEITGGVQFVNSIKSNPLLKHIPIIILSIHPQNNFSGDLDYPIDDKTIFYVNRNEDANNNWLYPLVEKIISNS